jgi:hypothetical protein
VNVRRVVSRASIVAASALLALLALAAMHALPAMGMAMPSGILAADASGAGAASHPDAMTNTDPGAMTHTDPGAMTHPAPAPVAAATHAAGGVPVHGHSLLHLCVAVLVAALTMAFARWLRLRAETIAPLVRAVTERPLFSLDIGPPRTVALCVVRC